MGMDSSIFMTRAVFLSLLFHVFVFILVSFFLTVNPPTEVFPQIKIYFSASSTESAGSESEKLTAAENPGIETIKKTVNEVVAAVENIIPVKPELNEPVVENSAETPPAHTRSFDSVFPEIPNEPVREESGVAQEISSAAVQPEIFEDSQTEPSSEEAVSNTKGSVSVIEEETGENVESPGINNDSAAGNSDNADLQWEGGAAVLRTIPDPDFNLRYDTFLPDVIKISFIVQHDGTVRSVKILPPKSGQTRLDEQIRTYVNSFLFDPFNLNEDEKKGILHLRLKEQGAGGI